MRSLEYGDAKIRIRAQTVPETSHKDVLVTHCDATIDVADLDNRYSEPVKPVNQALSMEINSSEESQILVNNDTERLPQNPSRLEPKTLTAAEASPSALAGVLGPSCHQASDVLKLVCEKPVAYNPRLPHPAISYAALGGKDVNFSEFFDGNDMFVDIMYRRVGKGGNKILLQEGEEITFPSVKNGESFADDTDVAQAAETTTSKSFAGLPKNLGFLVWTDDHVFGHSNTTGMSKAEATHQLHVLRNIHLTAQQQVTGGDEVMQQAIDLVADVAALVHLTQTVQLRQPIPPSEIGSSASGYDSGFTSKTQQKRARKMARRGDHKRQGASIQKHVQPRHMNSRCGYRKSYDTYVHPSTLYDKGSSPLYHSSEPPGSVSSAAHSNPSDYQHPYYDWQPDTSSQAQIPYNGPAWHPSVRHSHGLLSLHP